MKMANNLRCLSWRRITIRDTITHDTCASFIWASTQSLQTPSWNPSDKPLPTCLLRRNECWPVEVSCLSGPILRSSRLNRTAIPHWTVPINSFSQQLIFLREQYKTFTRVLLLWWHTVPSNKFPVWADLSSYTYIKQSLLLVRRNRFEDFYLINCLLDNDLFPQSCHLENVAEYWTI